MRHPIAVAAAVLALAGCGSDDKKDEKKPAAGKPVERSATLGAKAVKIVANDLGGGAYDTERLADMAANALPAIEAEAGFALAGDTITIAVFAEKKDAGDDATWDEASRTAKAWKGCPSFWLMKALGHAWFGDKLAKDRWIQEGLATHAAMRILRLAPWQGDPSWNAQALVQAFEQASDQPLQTWTTVDRALAGKAWGFFHAVAARAGQDVPKKASAAAAAKGAPVDTPAFLELLGQAGERARPLFPGWVTQGGYAMGASPKALHDRDGDGLTDLEEETYGTDPAKWDTDDDGRSDGDEVFYYKSSPTRADPPSPSRGGAVDDPAGDCAIAEADITKASISADAGLATFAIETKGGFGSDAVDYYFVVEAGSGQVLARFAKGKDPAVAFARGAPDPAVVEWRPLPPSRLRIEGNRATLVVPRLALGQIKSTSAVAFTVSGGARVDDTPPIKAELP